MKKHIIAFINSSLCQIGIFSILLLFLTCTIFGQSPKPFNQDSLTTTKKDIIGVLPNKIKAHLHNDSSLQKNKRLSFDVIPLDHQYWLTGNTNVNFNKLKLHLSGTTRYANSYGIGNASSFADTVSIQFSYLRVNQILFRELSPNLFAGIGYNLDYHWNVETNLTSDQESKKIAKLPKGSSSISSAISVNAQFDNRKNVVNPQNGTYVNVEFRQNLTMLGSDHNWQSLSLDIRHYLKLPASSRNILALRSYNNVILTGRPPYLDMPSIGWDECSGTGRGYTPGRFSGRDLVWSVFFDTKYIK